MKTKNFLFLCLILVVTLSFGCIKKEAAKPAAAAAAAAAPVVQELFSANWAFGAFIFDISLGNLTGAAFNSEIAIPNGDTCDCSTQITGTQTSGAIQQVCVLRAGGTDGSCPAFSYVGGSTYTNTTGTFIVCKAGNCGNDHTYQ